MELRSTKIREYRELELTLRGYGVFEEGMELEEMRQIVQAIDISAIQYVSSTNADMERALVESELDFAPPSNLLSSTMIVNLSPLSELEQLEQQQHQEPQNRRRVSQRLQYMRHHAHDQDTPPREGFKLLVRADVHHTMDWSPPCALHEAPTRLQRKRLASDASSIRDTDSRESDSKRSLMADESLRSLACDSSDSGVNWDERGSSLYDESHISFGSAAGYVNNQFLRSTSSAAISDTSYTADWNEIECAIQQQQ